MKFQVLIVVMLASLGCDGGLGETLSDAAVEDATLADVGSFMVDGGQCGLVTQSGCAAGEKCTLIRTMNGSFIGCTSAGEDLLNAECATSEDNAPDSCAAGYFCDGFEIDRCLEFCEKIPLDTCSGAGICAYHVDIDGDMLADMHFCAMSCDPLLQDCEFDEMACYPSRAGAICSPLGGGQEAVPEGGTCDYGNSCEGGLGCFRLSDTEVWQCFVICAPDGRAGPMCDEGQICIQIEDEAWGICIQARNASFAAFRAIEKKPSFEFTINIPGTTGTPIRY